MTSSISPVRAQGAPSTTGTITGATRPATRIGRTGQVHLADARAEQGHGEHEDLHRHREMAGLRARPRGHGEHRQLRAGDVGERLHRRKEGMAAVGAQGLLELSRGRLAEA
jgi:hypothetical protein